MFGALPEDINVTEADIRLGTGTLLPLSSVLAVLTRH